jgi:hypothetical protein
VSNKERHPTAGAPGFQDKQSGGLGIGFVVVVALIAFVTGGIVTMAVTGPSRGATATEQPPVSTALPTQTAPTTPAGQTTDPLKRRRPLTDYLSPQEIENLQKNLADGKTEGTLPLGAADGSSPTPAIPITANPNIPNPEPWQYDPATNKFWHPGHSHWHDGQPPPPDQRQ